VDDGNLFGEDWTSTSLKIQIGNRVVECCWYFIVRGALLYRPKKQIWCRLDLYKSNRWWDGGGTGLKMGI
jgi:hypothetical protein